MALADSKECMVGGDPVSGSDSVTPRPKWMY